MNACRHILSTLLLLVATAGSASAQPQASWLESSHDYGVIREQDGKVHCTMRVTNRGNQPLFIVKAQAACGCTSVTYPEEAIMPGDTAAVNVTYNPSGRPGEFDKQVLIVTNAAPKRTVLHITGNVIPTGATLDKQYPLQAGSLRISQRYIPFGEIPRGQSKTLYLSVYNASTDSLLVTVQGGKQHLRPAVVPDTVPPARVSALTVHYLAGQAPLWGLNTDTLTLTCQPTGGATTATAGSADIEVMAQVVESFDHLTAQQRATAPVVSMDCGDRLDFGTMTKGQAASRTFTITNRGKDPLAIRRLWVPQGEGVTLSTHPQQLKHGKRAKVTVTVDTSLIPEHLLNVPLTIITNDPQTPRMTVRLVGIIN